MRVGTKSWSNHHGSFFIPLELNPVGTRNRWLFRPRPSRLADPHLLSHGTLAGSSKQRIESMNALPDTAPWRLPVVDVRRESGWLMTCRSSYWQIVTRCQSWAALESREARSLPGCTLLCQATVSLVFRCKLQLDLYLGRGAEVKKSAATRSAPCLLPFCSSPVMAHRPP